MSKDHQTTARIRHLFDRAGFGATPAEIDEAARTSVKKVVRSLLKDSEQTEPFAVINPAEFDTKKQLKGMFQGGMLDRQTLKTRIRENAELVRDLNVAWLDRMASGRRALREKMALFWHGHFACRAQGRNALVMQQYANTIQQHALGKFGDLLMAVSKTPAMLQFLNAQQNRKNAPNENFAREVMELFTLGRGNYTEHDIKEAARAFTGWGFNVDGEFVFRRMAHDDGEKTVLGKTGHLVGEDVIAILIEKPQTARFITSKIYRYFVNEQENKHRVDELADRFYRSQYDIAALMETIFTADWFYDQANIGAHIKSPVELLAGMRRTLGVSFDQPQPQVFVQRTLGQILFYPPNVAGWPGGKNWIDSSSLLFRMRLPEFVLKSAEINIKPKDEADVNAELLARRGKNQFTTTVNWSAFEKAFAKVKENELADTIAAYLLPYPLQNEQRTIIATQLKPGQPHSERIHAITTALMSLPEYQLS